MKRILLFALFISVLLVSCGPTEVTKELQKRAQSFGKLPEKMPGSENDFEKKIFLGQKLYFDKRLSINNTQSCASCHQLDNGGSGADGLKTAVGALGIIGERNSPTVLNAGFHVAQFWDGRAPDLKAQAKGPILAHGEMAMPSESAVLKKLKEDHDYVTAFNIVYRDGMTYDNLADAIAAFERTLITRDRFEDFVGGDYKALSTEEQEGFGTFMNLGCGACHGGATFGGKMFMKLGTVNAYPTKDLGRYNVTKQESDKYVFKVPSLKNVALTAPYFHDGSVPTLEEAVEKMAYHQLGRELSKTETKSIVSFLNTLSKK